MLILLIFPSPIKEKNQNKIYVHQDHDDSEEFGINPEGVGRRDLLERTRLLLKVVDFTDFSLDFGHPGEEGSFAMCRSAAW